MENQETNKNRDKALTVAALFAASAALGGAGVVMSESGHRTAPASEHQVVFGQSDLRVAGEVPEKVVFGQSDLAVSDAVAPAPSPSTLVDVPHKVIFGQSDLRVGDTPAPIKPHGIS
jgi:hypothetical protein